MTTEEHANIVDANIRRCVQRRRYHWEDQAGTAAEGLTPPGRAYRCPVCDGFHVEPAAEPIVEQRP